MLQKTKPYTAIQVLAEAKAFDWQVCTLEHMSIVHQDLCWCISEHKTHGSLCCLAILAELKSYRLAFACRIEYHQNRLIEE